MKENLRGSRAQMADDTIMLWIGLVVLLGFVGYTALEAVINLV